MKQETILPVQWRVTGRSVCGASHRRAGKPNQDAVAWQGGTDLVVSCVSDGHGSARHFRSDKGSKLAVEEAVRVVREFVTLNEPRTENLRDVQRLARDQLPKELTQRWSEAVRRHLESHEFTEAERESLEAAQGPDAWLTIEENPLKAYGATLIIAAVCSDFALYLQLGDGDILTVSKGNAVTGTRVDRPVPEDERLLGNDTTSLCIAHAWADFRFAFAVFDGMEPPDLILISTDGYVNSFEDDKGFLQVGSDLLQMIEREGFDPVESSLAGWLERSTRAGSGDDITVALLSRIPAARLGERIEERSQEEGDDGVTEIVGDSRSETATLLENEGDRSPGETSDSAVATPILAVAENVPSSEVEEPLAETSEASVKVPESAAGPNRSFGEASDSVDESAPVSTRDRPSAELDDCSDSAPDSSDDDTGLSSVEPAAPAFGASGASQAEAEQIDQRLSKLENRLIAVMLILAVFLLCLSFWVAFLILRWQRNPDDSLIINQARSAELRSSYAAQAYLHPSYRGKP